MSFLGWRASYYYRVDFGREYGVDARPHVVIGPMHLSGFPVAELATTPWEDLLTDDYESRPRANRRPGRKAKAERIWRDRKKREAKE